MQADFQCRSFEYVSVKVFQTFKMTNKGIHFLSKAARLQPTGSFMVGYPVIHLIYYIK